MATKIITKNSSTATSIPTAGDLVQGELAVNVTDKRLFTEDSGGAIVELGTNPSTLTVTGEIAANGGIALGDNDKATFGASDDLQIYHNGGTSVIEDSGTGNLQIRTSTLAVVNAAGTEVILQGVEDGAVSLYYNAGAKLETTATGIDVTGAATFSGDVTVNSHLEVQTGGVGETASFGGDDASGGRALQIIASTTASLGDTHTLNATSVSGVLQFATQGLTRLKISSTGTATFSGNIITNGNVLMGVTTSSLALSGGTASNVGANILCYGSTHASLANTLVFRNSASEAARIDASGNLGIGTSSPTSRLQLDGAENRTGGLTLSAGGQNHTYFLSSDFVNVHNIETSSGAAAHTWQTNGTERIRIDASGNLGIGTSSPTDYGATANTLEVKGASGSGIGALQLQGADSVVKALLYAGGSAEFIINTQSNHNMSFNTNNTRAMTIDTSGNLLVGTTDSNPVNNSTNTSADNGVVLGGGGAISVARYNNTPMFVNRTGTDGAIIDLRKSGVSVGSIGVSAASSYLTIGNNNTSIQFYASGIAPATGSPSTLSDNSKALGALSVRWNDIYCTNGTIQTSDRNEKQDIEELNTAETAVAVACKGLLRKFRWIDAVEEKGADARIHFGIIAQDLQAAFAAEGLDAGDYAMFISSTWWETQTEVEAVEAVEFVQAVEAVYDEDGELVSEAVEGVEAVEAKDAYTRTDTFQTLADAPEGATERTRLGVRYPELLAFIIAAI